MYDQKIIVFKMESDVMLYVVGSADENEVLLYRYGLEGTNTGTLANMYIVLFLRYETRSTSSSSKHCTAYNCE